MADQKNPTSGWTSPDAFELWRNDYEPAPPAYNTLEGSSQHVLGLDGNQTCCAFERLNAITHPSNHHVFHRTPQLRLIGWVVLCRATDDSLTYEQRFSCPLASCDAQFSEDEHLQLVNHVSACRHLADGEYLCPYHGVIENFMAPANLQYVHRASKRHFLKRTIGKICRLGSRSLRNSLSHPGAAEHSTSACDGDRRRSSSRKRPRLDQISHPIVSQPIVHAPVFSPQPPPPPPPPGPPPVELYGDDIPELEAWTGPTLAGPPNLDRYQELPTAEPQAQEMMDSSFSGIRETSDNRFSNSSWASASDSVFTTGDTLSPVSPISRPDSYFSMNGFDCPVSQTDKSLYQHRPMNNPFLPPQELSATPVNVNNMMSLSLSAPPPTIPPPVGRKSPRPIPSIRVDTSFNTNTTSNIEQISPFSSSGSSFGSPTSEVSDSRDSGLFSATTSNATAMETKTPRHLVAELRGLFNTLFKVSLRKLCADPSNQIGGRVLSWNASPAQLFERGMRALQKVVNGEMPSDIGGIFGMSLLTYACGLADADFSMPDQFSSIFEQQLRWSTAIEDDEERDLYTNLIHQLWAPSGWDAQKTQSHGDWFSFPADHPYAPAQVSFMGWDSWGNDTDLSLGLDGMNFLFGDMPSDSWKRPPSAYLNGAAVGLCQRFLDNFEYLMVDLNELNKDVRAVPDFDLDIPTDTADPSAMNQDILMNNVIRPLANNPALQSFMSVVEKASLLLDTFPNMPLRNTELTLMQEGKTQRQASQLLKQAFTHEVQRVANEASDALGCGAGYRSYYYSRDIDKILSLHEELLSVEASNDSRRSRSSSLSSGKGKAPATTSPTSTYPSEGSLPSTPCRQPWSVEMFKGYHTGILHSRNTSADEIPEFFIEPSGTIDPRKTINRNSAPTFSSTTTPIASTAPRGGPRNRSGNNAPRAPRRPKSTTAASMQPGVSTSPVLGSLPPTISTSTPASAPTPAPLPTSTSAGIAGVPPLPADGKATQSCNICGQRFEGKAQWIRANVTRHIREKHRGNVRRLECGMPRCSYSSTRKGNLTHHRRTVHGVDS